MKFADVLRSIREQSLTEKEKGTKFEQLMKRWLQTDPRYAALTDVWLWEEFPAKKDLGGKDLGDRHHGSSRPEASLGGHRPYHPQERHADGACRLAGEPSELRAPHGLPLPSFYHEPR